MAVQLLYSALDVWLLLRYVAAALDHTRINSLGDRADPLKSALYSSTCEFSLFV